MASVFGNVHLGYIVIETDKFADWRRFGRDAIGMHLDETLSDVMRFRLDDNECRFLLQRGPAEDATALGWQLDDHRTFDEILTRITRHGVPVTEGTAEEAALRGVERLVRFPGPNGLAQEIFTRARTSDTSLNMRVAGGFVTGEFGMGHVAIATKKPHQMRGYYDTVFDARLSDYIDETISGVKLKIRFLRVNQRHHSVAIAAVNRLPVNPIRTRIQHLNVQVADLDDMTASYQRVKELGFDMALAVGQHTADAAALARDLNDYTSVLVATQPERFGFFATIPMPHIDESVAESVRALDDLKADGVVLLANSAGTYLGEDGGDELFAALDGRSAVVFIHPADLPGPTVPGVAPFAVDFLLDTTRAAYLLVRNGIRRRYPNIKFILSHAGGFVPYASHRMAVAIMAETGASPADSLDDFSGFYFDTALSSSAAALPTLLAFAKPGHITFGSDWPFAPVTAGKLFAAGLDTYPGLDARTRDAINRTNALTLFPRLGKAPVAIQRSCIEQVRHTAGRVMMRGVARLIS
jgi:2,3-dihydroxybiphenyl 1,2-dioxygenase